MKRIVRLAVVLLALCTVLPALAQNYPAKSVRLVSTFPPGGSVDVVGRILAAKLTETLGQQFIVDNRSGASGNIGMEFVARSAPDGYTLVINTLPLVSNQFLMSRVPYDPVRDFAPISLVTSSPSRSPRPSPASSTIRRQASGRIRTSRASSSTCSPA